MLRVYYKPQCTMNRQEGFRLGVELIHSHIWWLTIRLMKCVQSSENGLGGSTKRLSEVNEPKQDGKNEVGGGVVGQGQGRSEDGVLRVTEDSKDADHGPNASLVQPLGDGHIEQAQSQPQPQGKMVCWERFLPLRSLKILLVESDDCTRHVVSALLRNCSYEVTAVSNGIEAWKFLTNLDNQIDLILTEVVMTGLSGISLLSKIMAHKNCRNIPVIMMSCYDSMGIVLKCLSNGAADFLVKPIRKNELKNLWQHVWRRCHSSSGSGSESGVGNEKSITAKSAHDSDNDTGSNEDGESRSFGLQGWDGSDNGSGIQSSWTKRAAEVNSPQPPSLSDQLADPPDSTCAQVIYPRSEAFASSWVPASMEECKGHNNELDKFSMGKDLEIGLPKNTEPQPKAPRIKESKSSRLDLNLKTDGMNLDKKLDISNDKQKGDTVNLPRDTISTFEHSKGSTGSGIPTALPELPKNNEEDVPKMPSMELSLNRLSDHTEASNVSEQNVLRHSELSAFTRFCRYNSCSTANQGLTGNVGSCSPADNNSEGAKKLNSDSTPNQNSNNSSNNNDMGSTTNRSSSMPVSAADKPPEKSILKCSNQTLGFQIAKTSPTSDSELMVSAKPRLGPANIKLQDGFSLKIMNGTVTEGGSLNSKGALTDVNVVNYSVNGSVCGSNQGSNGQNGGSAAVNVEGMNMVHGNGIAVKVCTDNGRGSGSGSGVGIDQSRSAQREAALIKFRQKRKERCFDKKVRYQSRKKLAEQRPRVRGQFIKQVQDNKAEDSDS